MRQENERESERDRKRGKANTWASLRFVAPLIAECSEDVTAFQPNRSFLSPSLFITDLLSSSALEPLSLIVPSRPAPSLSRLFSNTPAHPQSSPPRCLPARLAGAKYLYKSVTGACEVTAGGDGWGCVLGVGGVQELREVIASQFSVLSSPSSF